MAEELSMRNAVLLAIIFGVVFAFVAVGFMSFRAGRNIGGMAPTGTVGAELGEELGIEVDPAYATINFGTVTRGEIVTSVPGLAATRSLPFLVRNIGNVKIDAAACADKSLWDTGTAMNFRFNVADADSRVVMDTCLGQCFDLASSPTTSQNIPLCAGSPPLSLLAYNNMNWEEPNDEGIYHVTAMVPMTEPPGPKSSIITFTAMVSSTWPPS